MSLELIKKKKVLFPIYENDMKKNFEKRRKVLLF